MEIKYIEIQIFFFLFFLNLFEKKNYDTEDCIMETVLFS